MEYTNAQDPHVDLHVATEGPAPDAAAGAVILLHGRGRRAESILSLARSLARPDFAYLAPQAASRTWYPHSFLVPLEDNEPALSSGLRALDRLVLRLGDTGIPPERVVLAGFSQGACVAVEFAARHPRRYGGVAAFIGGLFGPEGTPRDYEGYLDGTPVWLGTSDPDPFVPPERVVETAEVLERMGAEVELRIRPDAGHVIVPEDVERTRALMEAALDVLRPIGAGGVPRTFGSAPRSPRTPGADRRARTRPSER